ncbi:uncharacterized protein LOC112889330 isoform X2 [Panicum hallii]|uniref:uncharacterized protein LOC112889330 isoform X2 n=1 Tax=Panicum hallii TaxID=206008 RepID=UPI000DF4CBB7|nr:uncharacterized protein LOC112889330 isoform X2 [Panicum hallii]
MADVTDIGWQLVSAAASAINVADTCHHRASKLDDLMSKLEEELATAKAELAEKTSQLAATKVDRDFALKTLDQLKVQADALKKENTVLLDKHEELRIKARADELGAQRAEEAKNQLLRQLGEANQNTARVTRELADYKRRQAEGEVTLTQLGDAVRRVATKLELANSDSKEPLALLGEFPASIDTFAKKKKTEGCQLALAASSSHYPLADFSRVATGFASTMTQEAAEELWFRMEDPAKLLAEKLDVEESDSE